MTRETFLPLLQKFNRKCGKSTYVPGKQEEGPEFYQETSILKGAARSKLAGRLVTVKRAMKGSRLKTSGGMREIRMALQ